MPGDGHLKPGRGISVSSRWRWDPSASENMSAFSIPPLTLEVVEGDIAAQSIDVIVNAANNALWMGSGVAGAIKSRGGKRIEDEAMAQGPVWPGECVLTSAGRLAAKHVIHAAVMGQDLVTSEALIEAATGNALRLADSRGLASIALPAFGTGVGGFPIGECARIMIRTVRAYAPHARSLRLVRLVLFGRDAHDAFERAAGESLDGA
jgi:O-acetyl-ADP-ribose deacetylase (regulator of RNase III)